MPIPNNITREHVFRAIIRIIKEDVPDKRDFRKWALEYDGDLYPVKLVISWANVYPNGEELDPSPDNFTTYMAQRYLKKLKFNIIPV